MAPITRAVASLCLPLMLTLAACGARMITVQSYETEVFDQLRATTYSDT